jgi:uncharacterized protein (TIRG00374 family)
MTRRRLVLINVAKASCVAVFLYLLARKNLISVDAMGRALTQWNHTLPAFALLSLTPVLGIIRWRWLLAAQNIHLSWLRTTQLTLVGMFFNMVLPGSVSGDVLKGWHVARDAQGRGAQAFGSVVFDRVMGLSALVMLSAGALLLGVHSPWAARLAGIITVFGVAAAVAVLVFFGYLFTVGELNDPLLRILVRTERKCAAAGVFRRTYESIRSYRAHRQIVIRAVVLSIIIHGLVGLACFQFACALGETRLSPLSLMAVVPLGLLVTAIPISPGAVGTGHAAFLSLFRVLGSERGADVFSLYLLFQFVVGGLGGVVYVWLRNHDRATDLAGRTTSTLSIVESFHGSADFSA